jgi:hypothetical protein
MIVTIYIIGENGKGRSVQLGKYTEEDIGTVDFPVNLFDRDAVFSVDIMPSEEPDTNR